MSNPWLSVTIDVTGYVQAGDHTEYTISTSWQAGTGESIRVEAQRRFNTPSRRNPSCRLAGSGLVQMQMEMQAAAAGSRTTRSSEKNPKNSVPFGLGLYLLGIKC